MAWLLHWTWLLVYSNVAFGSPNTMLLSHLNACDQISFLSKDLLVEVYKNGDLIRQTWLAQNSDLIKRFEKVKILFIQINNAESS